jgi:hypothetical protein
MKNLMNVALVLLTLTLLSGTMLGQVRLLDGTGNPDAPKLNWVDADGDGICDNFGTELQGVNSQMKMNKGVNKGTGLGDGTGAGYGRLNSSVAADGTTVLQKGYGRRGLK